MGEKLFDFWASRFVRLALVVKQDGLFDPIAIRFLRPVGVILQTQPLADWIKGSFFDGSLDHLRIFKFNIILYNVR